MSLPELPNLACWMEWSQLGCHFKSEWTSSSPVASLPNQTSLDFWNNLAGILTTVLYRSRTGFHKTDTVIRRLIRGAVQTGVFASIFSLGDLVAFLTSTDSNLYGMFAFPVGRIYTNVRLSLYLKSTSTITCFTDINGYSGVSCRIENSDLRRCRHGHPGKSVTPSGV